MLPKETNFPISICMKISKLPPAPFDPEIINKNMKLHCFIHIHESKLYGINIIGHVLWEIFIFLTGWKLSEAKAKRTLWGIKRKLSMTRVKLFPCLRACWGALIIHPWYARGNAISYLKQFLKIWIILVILASMETNAIVFEVFLFSF